MTFQNKENIPSRIENWKKLEQNKTWQKNKKV